MEEREDARSEYDTFVPVPAKVKRPAAPKKRASIKQKWDAVEEANLKEGVAKYGIGKWRQIQQDPVFGAALSRRSNVDLKDKWRNMQMDLNGARRPANFTSQSSPGGHRRHSQRQVRRKAWYDSQSSENDDSAPMRDVMDQEDANDSENEEPASQDTGASQESTYSSDLARAAVIVLQVSKNQPVSLEKIINWLKAALARPAINEQAVRVKLEELRDKQMLVNEGDCWRLTGFLGALASGVGQFYSHSAVKKLEELADQPKNDNGELADLALAMMATIREAEDAVHEAVRKRDMADQVMKVNHACSSLDADGEVQGPFRPSLDHREAQA